MRMKKFSKTFGVAILSIVVLVVLVDQIHSIWLRQEWRSEQITQVSLLRLVAVPERYDGIRVAVNGFFFCEPKYEVCGVFLSENDLHNGIGDNGIEINFYDTSLSASQRKGFSGHYVRIVGTFKAHADTQWVAARAIGGTPVLTRIEKISLRPHAQYVPSNEEQSNNWE